VLGLLLLASLPFSGGRLLLYWLVAVALVYAPLFAYSSIALHKAGFASAGSYALPRALVDIGMLLAPATFGLLPPAGEAMVAAGLLLLAVLQRSRWLAGIAIAGSAVAAAASWLAPGSAHVAGILAYGCALALSAVLLRPRGFRRG
jgi:hypothetical protein